MFNITERLVEGMVSAYSSKVEAISKIRVEQLTEIRAKIRTNPDEVEAWFEREIEKIREIDLSDLLRNIRG